MTFVLLLRVEGHIEVVIRGPYRSFKRAEGDAKAWNGIGGFAASVEPVLPVRTPPMPTDKQLLAAIGPCGK